MIFYEKESTALFERRVTLAMKGLGMSITIHKTAVPSLGCVSQHPVAPGGWNPAL